MKELSQVIEKINTVFSQDFLDQAAKKSGLIKRSRKLCPKKFLESLLRFRFKSTEGSLESLALELNNNGCFMSKTSVYNKMKYTTVDFLKNIFNYLIFRDINDNNSNIKIFDFISSIIVSDSTKIGLNNKLKEVYGSIRNQLTGFKLQSIIDVLNAGILHIDICNLNDSDQGYKEHVKFANKGVLLMSDLGYFDTNIFKQIEAEGGYYLSRLKKRVKIYDANTKKEININKMLKKNKSSDYIDCEILLGQKTKQACRLVALKLDENSFKKRLKNLLEKEKKSSDNRIKLNDIWNKWTIFVTNLDTRIEAKCLLKLYSLRWQIELLFKSLKSLMKLRKIDDINKDRAQISFYLSMIAAAIVTLVSRAVPDVNKRSNSRRSVNELSTYKMFKIISSNIGKLIEHINENIKDAIYFLINILTLYAKKESRPKRLSTRASLWAESS